MHLIIDGGKSKTDALLVDPRGVPLQRATGPGLEIIGSPRGVALVTSSLKETLSSLTLPEQVHTVCFGLNGVHAPDSGVEPAVAVVSSLVAAERYVVASDVVMTFVGALGIQPGAVVAAGTGSVILAVSREGQSSRVDGHGPLLADRGSGYEVGRRGLKDALRVADGVPGSAALYEQLLRRFGDPRSAMDAVYGGENPSKVIASFSREVAVAAAEGDDAATAIWAAAGRDLAASVAAAAASAGLTDESFPVSCAGGLFSVGALLSEPFEKEIGRLLPRAELQPARGGALEGGVALALRSEPALTDISAWIPAGTRTTPIRRIVDNMEDAWK